MAGLGPGREALADQVLWPWLASSAWGMTNLAPMHALRWPEPVLVMPSVRRIPSLRPIGVEPPPWRLPRGR